MILQLLVAAGFLVALSPTWSAEVPVTATIDTTRPGSQVPSDFVGIAYEISHVPPENGTYYFRPDNAPLLRLYQTLGLKNIRIGGNTADLTAFKFPDQADVDSLFTFARAAHATVDYTFRLRDGSVSDTATLAKYIADHYGPELSCFAIGNEPNGFNKTYPDYLARWTPFYQAILAAVPNAEICGPNSAGTAWAKEFARDFGSTGRVRFIATHDYPCGAGNAVKTPEEGIDHLLSPQLLQGYQNYYHSFVPEVLARGLPFRIEEINSFYNGGAPHVSDTFASALWTLDYLHWWAEHSAGGINFQNGDTVAFGRVLAPCYYAAFTTSKDGYFSHPSAYGIKAFDLAGFGPALPVRLDQSSGSGTPLNLTVYAVQGLDHRLYLTLINKEHGAAAQGALVTLKGVSSAGADMISLQAPNDEVASTRGVTLGGAPITDQGEWSGQWTPLPPTSNHAWSIPVPATRAVLIRFDSAP